MTSIPPINQPCQINTTTHFHPLDKLSFPMLILHILTTIRASRPPQKHATRWPNVGWLNGQHQPNPCQIIPTQNPTLDPPTIPPTWPLMLTSLCVPNGNWCSMHMDGTQLDNGMATYHWNQADPTLLPQCNILFWTIPAHCTPCCCQCTSWPWYLPKKWHPAAATLCTVWTTADAAWLDEKTHRPPWIELPCSAPASSPPNKALFNDIMSVLVHNAAPYDLWATMFAWWPSHLDLLKWLSQQCPLSCPHPVDPIPLPCHILHCTKPNGSLIHPIIRVCIYAGLY